MVCVRLMNIQLSAHCLCASPARRVMAFSPNTWVGIKTPSDWLTDFEECLEWETAEYSYTPVFDTLLLLGRQKFGADLSAPLCCCQLKLVNVCLIVSLCGCALDSPGSCWPNKHFLCTSLSLEYIQRTIDDAFRLEIKSYLCLKKVSILLVKN